MVDRQAIIRAVETYCHAETVKDKATWLALFADDVVHEDPVGIATRRGIAGVTELWEMIVKGDVDLRLTAEVIVCGHEAIGIMACETGPADARRKTGPIIDHFVFDDAGKITSLRAFYNFG